MSRINSIKHEGLTIYKNANTVSRVKAGHEPVQRWQHAKRNKYRKGGRNRFYSYAKTLLLLIGFFFLMGCNPTSKMSEAVILFDVTDPVSTDKIQKEKIFPYLLEEVLDLSSQDLMSHGVNITISSIGSTSIQYTEVEQLEEGGSFLQRTEKTREEKINSFKTAVNAKINSIAKQKQGIGKTVLMQNLCEHLNKLAVSKARKKVILIFSDLLENSQHVSFYHYRNNPSQILNHYETLAAKMDKICRLPSLDNITLTIVYLPTEETDQLFQASKAFWTKYFTDYGAKVVFNPNI